MELKYLKFHAFANALTVSGYLSRHPIMEREEVFQWLKNKDFDRIVGFLKTGKDKVSEDTILQQAVGHFFTEVIAQSEQPDNEATNLLIGKLYMLHSGSFFKFSEEQYEGIVTHLAKVSKKKEEALHFATLFPDNKVCAAIIAEANENDPQEVSHSQSDTISVKEVLSERKNLTSSIFNSKQERLFFLALRNCYPTHFIYPNIALSTILKRIVVENELSGSELKFFYNTTIDFVVIDQFNDFKPVFAIELDSEWHRLNSQGEKDAIKNKILKLAGLPTYRIEHTLKYKSVEDFEEVIMAVTTKSR